MFFRAGNSQETECSVGCFSTTSRTVSKEVKLTFAMLVLNLVLYQVIRQSEETPKSGRHCCEAADLSKWKCPDPGCKTNNQVEQSNNFTYFDGDLKPTLFGHQSNFYTLVRLGL